MITLRCEECGQSFRVKDQHAGKKTKCKACGASLRIPEPKPQQPEPKRVTRSVADDDWPVEADVPWDEGEEEWVDDEWDDHAYEDTTSPLPARQRGVTRKPKPKPPPPKPEPIDEQKNKQRLSIAIVASTTIGLLFVGVAAYFLIGGGPKTEHQTVRDRTIALILENLRETNPGAPESQAAVIADERLEIIIKELPWCMLVPEKERDAVPLGRKENYNRYLNPKTTQNARAERQAPDR